MLTEKLKKRNLTNRRTRLKRTPKTGRKFWEKLSAGWPLQPTLPTMGSKNESAKGKRQAEQGIC
jgi:hypothetical protein